MTLATDTQPQTVAAVSASAILAEMTTGSPITAAARPVVNVNGMSHEVFNFEVAGTHTYIADGMRVHNRSVLDFMSLEELLGVDASSLSSSGDFGSGPDYAEVQFRDANGNIVGSTHYKMEGGLGQPEARVFTTLTDGMGNLVQVQELRDANGKTIGDPVSIPLTGARIGQQIGAQLTPFISAAILDDDASHFDKFAANTLMGTFLENAFETGGGFLHDQIVSHGKQNQSFQAIAQNTWSDFGQELSQAASANAQNLLNKWIMAEVFGNTFNDDIEGKIGAAIAEQGISYITTATFHQVASLVTNDAVTLANYGFKPAVTNDFFNIDSIGAMAVGVILREALPTAYTEHGQIASALGSTAITIALSSGPAGVVAIAAGVGGWIIGEFVDAFFPEKASYFLAYDDATGDFFGDASTQEQSHGGSYNKMRALGNEYLNMINNQVDIFDSNVNNYDELAGHRVGYRNEKFYTRTPGGATNERTRDFSNAKESFFLTDMKNLDLVDGGAMFKKAIDEVNIANRWTSINQASIYNELYSNLLIAEEYQKYLENQDAIDALIQSAPESNFAAGWAVTFMAAEELGLTRNVNRFLNSETEDTNNYMSSGNDYVTGGSGDDLIRLFAGNDRGYGNAGADNIFGGGGNDTLDGGDGSDVLNGGAGNDTLRGNDGADRIIGGLGHDTLTGHQDRDTFVFYGMAGHDAITDFRVSGNDHDIIEILAHALTEAQTAYVYDDGNDAIVYFDEDSSVRLWGVSAAQLSATHFRIQQHGGDYLEGRPGWYVKFENPYATGETVTPFATTHGGTSGNETLTGTNGNDVIRSYEGNDRIYAGLGNDFIDAGAGDDWNIFGDSSSWNDGQSGGADVFFFARGNQVDQIQDFEDGVDKIQLGTGLSFEGVQVKQLSYGTQIKFAGGLAGDQILLKNVDYRKIGADDFIKTFSETPDQSTQPAAATHLGTANNDLITGSGGNDVIRGRAGDDNIYAGLGNDVIDAGAGSDWNVFGDANSWSDRRSGGEDIFFFKPGNGIDQVRDFEDGVDKIMLADGLDFDDIKVSQWGDITSIKFKTAGQDGDRLMLVDINQDQISRSDFVTEDSAPPEQSSDSGEADRNEIYGTSTGDVLTGTFGADAIFGKEGGDKIYAGKGNDYINPGAGNDWNVFGDADNWDVRHSGGADTFRFAVGNGVDQIRDFEDGLDKIDLSGGRDFDDVLVSEWDDTTYIKFKEGGESGDQLMLVDIKAWQIDAGDFV